MGMLIAANVGVGIRGKEGLQAVRAADFSIPEFKSVSTLFGCLFICLYAYLCVRFLVCLSVWSSVCLVFLSLWGLGVSLSVYLFASNFICSFAVCVVRSFVFSLFCLLTAH